MNVEFPEKLAFLFEPPGTRSPMAVAAAPSHGASVAHF